MNLGFWPSICLLYGSFWMGRCYQVGMWYGNYLTKTMLHRVFCSHVLIISKISTTKELSHRDKADLFLKKNVSFLILYALLGIWVLRSSSRNTLYFSFVFYSLISNDIWKLSASFERISLTVVHGKSGKFYSKRE